MTTEDIPVSWIKLVPEGDLDKLLDGLSTYMLFQAELYGRLMDEKWRRFANPIDSWPIVPVPDRKPIHDLKFIRYCSKAQSWNDPGHRPTRRLVVLRTATINYECSCGIRDGDARHQFGVDRFVRAPGPLWWPTRQVDGIVHYGVCPYAKYADDEAHAPMWFEECWGNDPPNFVRCTCRHLYALVGTDEDDPRNIRDANWMPAH